MGDLNIYLSENKQDITGNYVCSQGYVSEVDEILYFMKNHNLFATNTNFRKTLITVHVPPRDLTGTGTNFGH